MNLTNRELIDGFDVMQRRWGLRAGTIKMRRWLLESLARDQSLYENTAGDIDGWIDARNVSARTRKTYLSLLAPFYEWMEASGMRPDDPVSKIQRPRLPRMLPRPITTRDLRQAMSVAGPRMLAWLRLGAFEGLRCQEIAGLRREAVQDEAAPPVIVVEDGKGGKQRVLPLHPLVWEALVAYGMPKSGAIFRLDDGRPMTSGAVSKYVSDFFSGLGMRWSAHNLRHWFGTSVYRKTRDLRTTQEMMGHESPQTTAGYTAWSPEVANDAVTSLSIDEEGETFD